MEYGAIILAAGASTRMGTSKQLLKIKGQSLIRKTVSTVLLAGVNHVVVILGANASRHKEEIKDLAATILFNPNWELGIGSSIKVGVKHLSTSEVDALFILVCDQPYLSSNLLREMIGIFELSNHRIIASRYAKTVGVPALFDRSMFPTLLKVKDDEGAKGIISENENQWVDFGGGEIDLDTPDDLKKINV